MKKFHQVICKVILAGLGFIFICMPYTISAATLVTQDIGLRLRENGENIPIAVQPAATSTSPLKIYKNGAMYGIRLVPTNHPAATKLRIRLPSGQIMAVQRGCGKPWYPTTYGSLDSSTGVYTFQGAGPERDLVNCWTYNVCGASAGTTDCFPTSCSYGAYSWVVSPSSPDGCLHADQATANMVCQLQGYNRALPNGFYTEYGAYSSPWDNSLGYWNTGISQWIGVTPADAAPVYNQMMHNLQCDCNQP